MKYKINGKTLIENAVDTLKPFCNKIYVVVGYNHQLIRNILKEYSNIEIIYNENYKKGMFSSVKMGINNIECKRLLFMPGDYGNIKYDTVKKILLAKGDIIIPSYNYKRGHPICIKGSLLKEISENSKFKTLKDFVNTKEITYVNVDDSGILMDIDTLDDYKKVLECIKYENSSESKTCR